VSYGRGCQWCSDGQPSEHTCYNFYSDGGSTFCQQFAALNQCKRASHTMDTNESNAPEWLPLVGAVGACVMLAFGFGLWATKAQLLVAATAPHAFRFDDQSDSNQAHNDNDGPNAAADEVEAGSAQRLDEQGDTPAGEICVVCLQNTRTRMLYPCGHLVCCEGCAQRLVAVRDVRCPVCRKPVHDVVRVYG
jgi:hypothetical protein